jgi:hypothetical protein
MEKKTGYRDANAPKSLLLVITDNNGKEWGRIHATAKDFSTGSVGYYANGKLTNPDNPEARYQAGLTFTLIGSK